jgi:hypothetical protein
MALVPNIARAASAAAPAVVARAYARDGQGVEQLQAQASVVAGDQSFRYDDFAFLARQQFLQTGTYGPRQETPQQPRQPGRIDFSLLSNSTESFALAFQLNSQFDLPPAAPGSAGARATIDKGISTYEMTSAVIHDQLAPMGGEISVVV